MTPNLWADVDRILSAALDLPDSAREAYIQSVCAGRADLAAEVRALLTEEGRRGPLDLIEAATPGAHDDDDPGRGGPSLAGRRIGPYRLVHEIGRGGMGSVWLAERDDRQFRKQVAVKFLSAGLPVAEALRRFREERQILAGLEHPHIARLLDAGQSEDGLHYIVMEYVEGVAITDHSAARRLTIRERVELLRAICSTVHFAHQHLVVHRDLKPANILVTADGGPKLLDFGVAKMLTPVETDSTFRTAPLLQPFTPAYSSPEQLRGAPATTSSDVYSLGVLCYELLTGVNPHRVIDGSTETVFQTVCEREPEPPSAIGARRFDPAAARAATAALAGDLDAIVLKAMRKVPQERYASAEELADDLGRYLAGLPVDARRGTWRYRAQKFATRHRMAVSAAMVAIIAAAIGVSAVLWQAGVARRERAAAERRFNDVRKLARALIFDLYDRIAQLPGSTAARQALVTEALQYLNRLAQETGGDPDLALELAEAYARVGEVQGNPGLANLGDTAGALASYDSARQILDDQLARRPNDPQIHRLLARIHTRRGDVLMYLRKTDDARSSFHNALRLREALAASGRDEDRRDLAGVYFRLADVVAIGDLAASLQPRRRALDIFEALLAAHPDDQEALRNAALTYKTIGNTLIDMERDDEAKPELMKALAVDEKRVRINATSAVARLDLSFDLSLLASVAHNQGNFADALAYWQRTIDTRRSLVDADPKDARARGRLAFAYLRSATTRMAMPDHRGALDDLKTALALSEALVSANPEDSVSRSYAAEALASIGYSEQALARSAAAAERRTRLARACTAFARAHEAYTKNMARKTASTSDREEAAKVEKQLAACR